MKYLCKTALFCIGILGAQAQTPVAAPAPGPTMEQTTAFINESLAKRGDVTYFDQWLRVTYKQQPVSVDSNCVLTVNHPAHLLWSNGSEKFTDGMFKVRAATADPRTVTVKTIENSIPLTYQVIVDQYLTEAELDTKGLLIKTDLAFFSDKDLADRVAKAFIHAIVLCHKDAKPSLF